MASVKTVLYLGVCLSAWCITAADKNPVAENVRWVSLDFKTILTWTTKAPDYKYSVLYTFGNGDWVENIDCFDTSATECDLTNDLKDSNRVYTAKIQTELATADSDYDPDMLFSTTAPLFNPYKESNISAVNFTVETIDESTVIVNITDPLTGIHERGKQLSLRDVFKKELNYNIIYWKSGSTGKRDIISSSSIAEVSKLDAGQSYCFMVAAFIPSRPQTTQQGAWSHQWCTTGGDILHELSLGAWVGIIFIVLTVIIIIVTVTVLCCRCCRHKKTTQSSSPV